MAHFFQKKNHILLSVGTYLFLKKQGHLAEAVIFNNAAKQFTF